MSQFTIFALEEIQSDLAITLTNVANGHPCETGSYKIPVDIFRVNHNWSYDHSIYYINIRQRLVPCDYSSEIGIDCSTGRYTNNSWRLLHERYRDIVTDYVHQIRELADYFKTT
jgi:hypothetical protein